MSKHNIALSSVSASKCEPSYFAGGRVRALSRREVKKVIRQFIDGAVRCQKAGVDGVELHGTHGYLIQQFLSPNTNHRTDEYGGSFENRLRFLREIVEGIRKECGNYPIIVRLTLDEFYSKIGKPGKGYDLETGVKYAKAIADMGVDAIDVSSAAYDTFNYWLEPTSFECGWRKYLAAAVKKEVNIPVIAANLIRTPEQAEKQLEEGDQDFVSLGRPHIADPHWAEKAQSGREKEIKHCLCCLYCIESMQDTATTGIAQSTRLSEEKRNLTTFLTTETTEWLSLSARALQVLLARKCWAEEVSRLSSLKKRTKSADKSNLPISRRRKKNLPGALRICAQTLKNSERKSF